MHANNRQAHTSLRHRSCMAPYRISRTPRDIFEEVCPYTIEILICSAVAPRHRPGPGSTPVAPSACHGISAIRLRMPWASRRQAACHRRRRRRRLLRGPGSPRGRAAEPLHDLRHCVRGSRPEAPQALHARLLGEQRGAPQLARVVLVVETRRHRCGVPPKPSAASPAALLQVCLVEGRGQVDERRASGAPAPRGAGRRLPRQRRHPEELVREAEVVVVAVAEGAVAEELVEAGQLQGLIVWISVLPCLADMTPIEEVVVDAWQPVERLWAPRQDGPAGQRGLVGPSPWRPQHGADNGL
mmetsp:Transcript_4256/g.11414  ORF Transcript_4256/g.11414 Transcript_4256/m.11414 type:complete len:299 (+) Transcript_4256:8-904(+)